MIFRCNSTFDSNTAQRTSDWLFVATVRVIKIAVTECYFSVKIVIFGHSKHTEKTTDFFMPFFVSVVHHATGF